MLLSMAAIGANEFDELQATPRRLPGTHTTSVHIVETCVRHAESVRYQGLTLSALSTVSGCSERRVHDAFCECHGMSPMSYLRLVALCEVRGMLVARPYEYDTVARAASDYGFWHLSRFAGQYRALFGESPHETMMRSRHVANPQSAESG